MTLAAKRRLLKRIRVFVLIALLAIPTALTVRDLVLRKAEWSWIHQCDVEFGARRGQFVVLVAGDVGGAWVRADMSIRERRPNLPKWSIERIEPPFRVVLRGSDGTLDTHSVGLSFVNPTARIEWSSDGHSIRLPGGAGPAAAAGEWQPGERWDASRAVWAIALAPLRWGALIPIGMLIVLIATRPSYWLSPDRHVCSECGYSLRGSSGKGCPECGAGQGIE